MVKFKGIKLQLISVNLPPSTIEQLENLVMMGIYPNRSEAIRNMILQGIKAEFEFVFEYETKSSYYTFLLEYLDGKTFFKTKNIIAEYVKEYYGFHAKVPTTEFKSLKGTFSWFVHSLVKRGYIVIHNEGNKGSNTYRIIHREFLD